MKPGETKLFKYGDQMIRVRITNILRDGNVECEFLESVPPVDRGDQMICPPSRLFDISQENEHDSHDTPKVSKEDHIFTYNTAKQTEDVTYNIKDLSSVIFAIPKDTDKFKVYLYLCFNNFHYELVGDIVNGSIIEDVLYLRTRGSSPAAYPLDTCPGEEFDIKTIKTGTTKAIAMLNKMGLGVLAKINELIQDNKSVITTTPVDDIFKYLKDHIVYTVHPISGYVTYHKEPKQFHFAYKPKEPTEKKDKVVESCDHSNDCGKNSDKTEEPTWCTDLDNGSLKRIIMRLANHILDNHLDPVLECYARMFRDVQYDTPTFRDTCVVFKHGIDEWLSEWAEEELSSELREPSIMLKILTEGLYSRYFMLFGEKAKVGIRKQDGSFKCVCFSCPKRSHCSVFHTFVNTYKFGISMCELFDRDIDKQNRLSTAHGIVRENDKVLFSIDNNTDTLYEISDYHEVKKGDTPIVVLTPRQTN